MLAMASCKTILSRILIYMIYLFKKKYTNLVSDKRFSEILTGSVWALSARVIATIFGLIFSMIVARVYGAEVIGILAVVNSFLVLTTLFTVFGTQSSILRLIPEHIVKYSPTSAFKLYRKTQYMVIGFSFITAIMFIWGAELIANKIFSKPYLSYYFSLASIFIVFKSIALLNTQAVRGLRHIKLFALILLLPQLLNLIFLLVIGFFISSKNLPIYVVFAGFTVTSILGSIIMEVAFKKKMHPSDPVCPIFCRNILSISLPMLLSATMAFIIGETGVLMLGMFRTEAEVGYYAIAVKLATLTSFVLQAVNSMAGPKFSELFHSNQMEELFYIAKKSAKLIFFITTPILLGLLIFGKYILVLLYGADFSIAYIALVLLIIGQFINSISGSTAIFMNMTGHQSIFRNIIVSAAILNISLNWMLIPPLGITGAAFSAMICLSSWNIATLIYMKKTFGRTTGFFPIIMH